MMSLDPIIGAIILLIIAILVLLVWNIRLEVRLGRLTRGRKASSLENFIVELKRDVEDVDEINEEIQKHLIEMEKRLQRSIQHIKTVRFNPFRDQGGNHSFATAFLDEKGDGAIISTLYSRDKVNVYAKPIKNRRSEFELTDEEKAALG